MTDTNELRKLLEKATPRPWIVEKNDYWDSWSVTGPAHEIVPGWPQNEPKAFDDGSACGEYGPSCTQDTRDLIVAAVNALPALLDELDALRARVAVLGQVREAASAVVDHARGTAMSANWMPVLAQRLLRLECALDAAKEATDG